MITTACQETWSILSNVAALKRVYAAGKEGAAGIPDSIGDQVPAVIIYPGQMRAYEQGPSESERHEYELQIQVFVDGSDTASKINTALVVFDAIKEAFRSAVAMNGISTAIQVARISSWRFGSLTYNGETFTGWDITLFVSEDEPVTYSR